MSWGAWLDFQEARAYGTVTHSENVMTQKTYGLFHPATGIPQACYVCVSDRAQLVRQIVRIQAENARSGASAKMWPHQIAARLVADYGVLTVPRPADVMSADFVDTYLEYMEPNRPDGAGDIREILADPDLSAINGA